MKTEAIQKFAAAGLNNVRVETAHSLAFDHVVKASGYKLVQGYKSHEWCDLLGIRSGDRHSDFIIVNHINKFTSLFCNSKTLRVQDLDYIATIADAKAAGFVKKFHSIIERFTREALAMMSKASIAITHDFYLKKFQLNQPSLPYDYILFDEGQDASAAMLDVFLKQENAIKIIVGDMHQQIYGWRYAINSLQQVSFPVHHLSSSFRFNEEVALVANNILDWKAHVKQPPAVKIIGAGTASPQSKTKAVLGRTNLNLLLNAISKWESGQIKNLFFEGNINSYTFADEGASLYDVLNLYNGKTASIKDKLLAEMTSMSDLEDYISKTEDNSLSMIVEVVKKFGNKLPGLIGELKKNHTATKEDAEMIFSTVHRCKGMEYDEVTLLGDFMNEEKLKRLVAQYGDNMTDADRNRLIEEINILYVAVTRTKNKLILPKEISLLKSIELSQPSPAMLASKTYQKSNYRDWRLYNSIIDDTDKPLKRSSGLSTNHGKRWTTEEEEELRSLFVSGITFKEIAGQLARGENGVKIKLKNMGLLDDDFDF